MMNEGNEYRVVWMQTVFKENGVVNALFKVDRSRQTNPDSNVGYIYVKDMKTNDVKKYNAEKINCENNIDTYKATYTPENGQETRIEMAVMIPSETGEEKEYVDTNGGYWYQA